MNNKKGYTLVEILVAMAILAIMATPILNIFIDSIRVNKMADDQYKADFIAQKFVEDLRVNDFPSELDTTTLYDGFSVNVIYKEATNDVETLVTEVKSNFTMPTFNAEIELYENSKNKIGLKNSNFNLSNLELDPNNYIIKIEDSLNLYKVTLLYGDLISTSPEVVDQVSIIDTSPFNLKIFKNRELLISDSQKTTFTILNTTTKEFDIFVVNDQIDNIKFLIDSSSNSVKITRNLTDLVHISNNNFKSYDVEVIVSKNNTQYTKLKTVISK